MIGLTLEQILQLHALVLVKDCGAGGVRDVGRLDAAVCAQTQVVFGEELDRKSTRLNSSHLR